MINNQYIVCKLEFINMFDVVVSKISHPPIYNYPRFFWLPSLFFAFLPIFPPYSPFVKVLPPFSLKKQREGREII